MPSTANKRIAKNTLFLYIRMLLVMAVNLYTVRAVLNILGVDDYGINNVVGGVVTMFSFLTGVMVSASQRFFAFELGKKDFTKLNNYFNLTLWCYLIIAIVVLFLAETIGLWFLHSKMIIPLNRMSAAEWVFQFSVLSFMIQMVVIPYNSVIIAREQMNIYAYVSIVEVLLKLAIVYILTVFTFDKLKLYSVLTCSVIFFTSSFYILYCNRKFSESKITFYWNKNMFYELISYCGWNLFGALSAVLRSQGINLLLNLFFNPTINAARAIAFQVNNAINQFINNFFQAVRPQITKQYATGEKENFMILIFRSSRFCYYLILFFAIPLLLETPYILKLWLKEIPEYTILFTRLVIITAIIESVSYPLMSAIQATGKMKWYQICTGGLLLLNLPISYLFLKLSYPPQITMIISIIIAVFSQIFRVFFSRELFHMSIKGYLRNVISLISKVTVLSFLIPITESFLLSPGLLRLIIIIITSIITCILSIYFVGITQIEQKMIQSVLLKKIKSQFSPK